MLQLGRTTTCYTRLEVLARCPCLTGALSVFDRTAFPRARIAPGPAGWALVAQPAVLVQMVVWSWI